MELEEICLELEENIRNIDGIEVDCKIEKDDAVFFWLIGGFRGKIEFHRNCDSVTATLPYALSQTKTCFQPYLNKELKQASQTYERIEDYLNSHGKLIFSDETCKIYNLAR